MHANLVRVFVALAGITPCVDALANCELVRRSEDVVLMHCQEATATETLVEAGKKVCGDDTRCNVWFWNSDVTLPESAPETDVELPKTLTSQALAVWANDSESLLTLRKQAQ